MTVDADLAFNEQIIFESPKSKFQKVRGISKLDKPRDKQEKKKHERSEENHIELEN